MKFLAPRKPSYVILMIVLLVVLLAIPFVVSEGLCKTFTFVLIGLIFVASYELLYGQTGILDLGVTRSVAIGGYTAALLFRKERFGVYDWAAWIAQIPPVPMVLSIVVGGLISCILDIFIGFSTLRVHGMYFTIITLLIPMILLQLTNIFSDLFGSHEGFTLGSAGFLHSVASIQYIIVLIVTVIIILFMLLLIRSKYGVLLNAIRDDEILCLSQGVPVFRYKLLVTALTALINGCAGALLVFCRSFVGQDLLSSSLLAAILIGAFMGGPGTFYGPLILGFVIFLLKYVGLQQLAAVLPFGITSDLILYALLIMVALVFPRGLWPSFQRMLTKRHK